ncbi:MAG: tetratricopeptide repeat protein [Bacteroidota bacterium]
MKKLFALLILFCLTILTLKSTNIDSLIIVADGLHGKEKVILLSDICYFTSFNNTDLSLIYGQKCLDEAKKLGDSLLIAEGYNVLAIVWYMKSDFQKSLDFNQKALQIRLSHGDNYSLLSSYSKIGNSLYELGKYDKAISFYIRSLKLCEENNYYQQIGLMSNNIAEIYKSQNKLEKARKYYHKSIKIANQLNDTIGLSKALINFGVSYLREDKYDKADSIFQIVDAMIAKKNMLDIEGGLMINFGIIYKAKGQLEKSITYYKKAKQIYLVLGEVYGLSIVYSNLGNSFIKQQKYDSALVYIQKGIALAVSTNSLVRLQNAYEGLSYYYQVTNNYRFAFTYDSLANIYKDSIYNIDNTKVIEELSTQYETEKKEKLLVEQKVEIAEQQIEVQTKNLQLLGAFVGILTMIIIGFGIYKNQKNKHEKLRQQVALEKAETINKIQTEKLRISRDLHDNIGSQLTFVISSLDNISHFPDVNIKDEKLAQLADFTKDTMSQLRDTIWAIQSESITIEQLSVKVAEFVNKAKLGFPEIKFKINLSQSQKKMNSTQAINAFRTIQEAINNAVKYANATCITFDASIKKITITDDGIGFDRASIAEGNGLANMENRMEEVGLSTLIISKKGTGTEVSIILS